jgi:hypothetical protein
MDCQEWKDKDLSEGYKHFVNTLNKYPTAIATRCFAFDPTENQPDDTKGLIMIPNVGNLSFYMSTMVCDFASEILNQFANIVSKLGNGIRTIYLMLFFFFLIIGNKNRTITIT